MGAEHGQIIFPEALLLFCFRRFHSPLLDKGQESVKLLSSVIVQIVSVKILTYPVPPVMGNSTKGDKLLSSCAFTQTLNIVGNLYILALLHLPKPNWFLFLVWS